MLSGADKVISKAAASNGIQPHGSKGHPKHAIGLFAFLAITSSMVMAIYNYPVFGTSIR